MTAVRRELMAGVVIALSLALLACGGPERSTAAFCDKLHSEKERILGQFKTNADPKSGDKLVDALAGLGASVQAIGELRTYFNKLSDVAPDDIRTEIEIVAKQYEKQFDDLAGAASNPLAGLAAGLLNSIAVSGQMNSVHRFALANCHEGL